MGKLIVIEGTDCSGKETQSKLLEKRLNEENIKAIRIQNPFYETATGRIIATCYLGKKEYCDKYLKEGIEGFFEEKAPNVDSITASLYYAADRRYNLPLLKELLNNYEIVILDRYIYSNMAHQGSKCETKEERLKLLKKLETLEFEICELPKADLIIFLHVPYEVSSKLKEGRKESQDQHESDKNHLKKSEQVYEELVKLYGFQKIECTRDENIRPIEEIHEEVYKKVRKMENKHD